ncbi:MAG: hypothetical protein ABW008_11795, partial [Acidimicrobiales bacterium]
MELNWVAPYRRASSRKPLPEKAGSRTRPAPAADHLLLPADERVDAVAVVGDQVPGAEPAVDHHRRGLLGHLEVAAHRR